MTNETKHTPGPWGRNIRAGGKYPIIYAGRNQHVAQAVQQKDSAETEANIDLIACAPELLEALENVADHCEGNMSLRGLGVHEAIAKAKGQS